MTVLVSAITPPIAADPVAKKPTSAIITNPMAFQISAFTSERNRVSIVPPEQMSVQVYRDVALFKIPYLINKIQQL